MKQKLDISWLMGMIVKTPCIIGLFWLVIGISTPVALGEESEAKNYYDQCIESRLENCERKASYETCAGPRLQECAARAHKEAAFLRANKDQLMADMESEKVKPIKYKVDYTLIKAYHRTGE
ncbi:MAG: hypothetical protein WHS46_11890 [Desulfosoma sp.]